MNGRDPVAVILATVDAPAAPRPEFAETLLARLLEDLGHGGAAAIAPPRRRLRDRVRPRPSPRLRLALIVLATLLLAAALAVAAYFGVRWLSAGPRGVQFSSDYRLTVVLRTQPQNHFWTNWQLGRDGRDVYALRQRRPATGRPGRQAELVRLPAVAVADRVVRPQRLWSFSELADAALWGSEVDVERAVFGPRFAGLFGLTAPQALAVASNGDIFLVAAAWRKADDRNLAAAPLDSAVLVRRADGRTQRVLSVDDLGLPTPQADVDLHVAASAPDRLWLLAWELRTGGTARAGPRGPHSLFEVRDRNGDGDWADRTVRRIRLPQPLRLGLRDSDAPQMTYVTQIVAEPALSGQLPSLLLCTIDHEGRFRVHRVTPREGAAPQVRRVVDVFTGFDDSAPPGVAARIVDGRREIVAAGLTRPTRLSIVADDGHVTDVARAFEHLERAPLAGSDGRLYAPEQVGGARGSRWLLYRLDAARPGRRTARTPAASPRAVSPAPAGATRAGPRIAFTIKSSNFRRGRIVVASADGGGRPRRLVSGEHNDGFCQSADGKQMAYFSDEEAPNEQFLYIARADGSHPRKVTERRAAFWCGFSSRWLLLGISAGPSQTLLRHDLRSGRESPLVSDVDRLALSPDGDSALFVGGLKFVGKPLPRGRETLEVVDLASGRRRRLAGPLTAGSFGTLIEGDALVWARDGSQVAYSVGPTPYFIRAARLGAGPKRFVIRVQPVTGGRARTVYRFRGGPPLLRFSPDGRHLLVCLANRLDPRHDQIGCNGTPSPSERVPRGRLVLVDLQTDGARTVAEDGLHWAGWSPAGGGFAYATDEGLFAVEDPARPAGRRLAAAPASGWPVGRWLGFSPEGRYIGLGDVGSKLSVVEVASGVMTVVARERQGRFLFYRKWWR